MNIRTERFWNGLRIAVCALLPRVAVTVAL